MPEGPARRSHRGPAGPAPRGMALIQALVSTVVFERHSDTNVWELRREYHGDQP